MPRESRPLSLGERLELALAGRWWPTRVEDIADGHLTVAWPMDADRRLLGLEAGDRLELLRVVAADGTYAACGAVSECLRAEVPLVRLHLDGDWQRSQRRGAFRATVAIRPRVAQIEYGEARRTVRLGITNVSASGLRVRAQDELRRGELLRLAFELDQEIELYARVGRVTRLERSWEAGCVFEGVSERLCERIVQFVFAQQRLELRARRGRA